VPDAVKPDTDEVGDVLFAKLTTAGFDADDVQVPVPAAVIAVLEYWQNV
jgi:hypothetical protein